jgi:hypothetical protein
MLAARLQWIDGGTRKQKCQKAEATHKKQVGVTPPSLFKGLGSALLNATPVARRHLVFRARAVGVHVLVSRVPVYRDPVVGRLAVAVYSDCALCTFTFRFYY